MKRLDPLVGKVHLKELRAQQVKLDVQIKRGEQLRQKQERKRDTRRKILIGAVVLELMKSNSELNVTVLTALQESIVRPVDRAVFAGFFEKNL